jgi:hypothetical protein
VLLVLLLAAAAIVAGVIALALGRGGELAHFPSDAAPWECQIATAADVAQLRPPAALFGYSVRATSQALSQIAEAVTERDSEIESLRRRLAELQAQVDRLQEAAPPPARSWPQWQQRGPGPGPQDGW